MAQARAGGESIYCMLPVVTQNTTPKASIQGRIRSYKGHLHHIYYSSLSSILLTLPQEESRSAMAKLRTMVVMKVHIITSLEVGRKYSIIQTLEEERWLMGQFLPRLVKPFTFCPSILQDHNQAHKSVCAFVLGISSQSRCCLFHH